MKYCPVLLCLFVLSCSEYRQPEKEYIKFPIMAWYNSEPNGEFLPVLNRLKNTGFNKIAVPFTDRVDNQKWLNASDSLGIQLVLSDNRIDQYIQSLQKRGSLLDSMIADYQGHTSFAGYFIYDKPDSQIFAGLSNCIRYLTEKDAQHPAIINVFPMPADEDASFYYDLWQIMDHVQPRLLCFEQYLSTGATSDYYKNLEDLRSVCKSQKVPFWVTLITNIHHTNIAVEKSQLKIQVFSALAYGASGLAYYTSSISYERDLNNALVNNKPSDTEYYSYVERMNRYLNDLSPVLDRLESVGVFHTGPVPAGCIPLSSGRPVTQITGRNFLLGFCKDQDNDYVWIVNKNIDHGATPQITFRPEIREIREITGQGQIPYHKIFRSKGEQSVRIIFKAGEGRLFQLGSNI